MIQRLVLQGKIMKMRAEQDALERRMKIEAALEEIYRRGAEPGLCGQELRYNHYHDSKGRFASKNSLTKSNSRDKIKIGKEEHERVTRKINSQYYLYHEKIGNRIYSAELSAYYDFDIIEFDNYIITDKGEI
ncbi:MAG: hypothetical protein J6I96_05575 [Oscillospiraceae bacterium]|nr:hypothetical protein [Oscillospiraceae bacterium]